MRPIRLAVTIAAALLAASPLAVPHGAAAQPYESSVRDGEGNRATERQKLFRSLAAAGSPAEALTAERAIWRFWLEAPDAEAAQLMNEALKRRAQFDLAGAHETLDALIARNPGWAEAWNQRATIRFMQGDNEASLLDIEETLAREPKHFGALAGQALILIHQGRARTGQSILRQATAIHPYLPERRLLRPAPKPTEERKI